LNKIVSPFTELLIRCADIVGTETARKVPALVMKACGRIANRLRHTHYYQGIQDRYHWAFGRRNAGDFMIFNQRSLNRKDAFFTRFFVKWSKMESEFKEDVLKLKVPPFKYFLLLKS
jgi:hypothetical protein